MLPHAFGVAVRDATGATLLASQDGARHDTRLRVLGGRPPSGPFRELRAVGSVAARGLSITTTHRFRAREIALRWDVRCRAACGARTVDVHLPTWGADAAIGLRLRAGGRTPLTGPVALADVAAIELGGRYEVTPLSRPAGAVLLPVATLPQPTAPHPGPTVAIRLANGVPFGQTGLAVRIRL